MKKRKINTIKTTPRDLSTLLICSFRYALGRRTYITLVMQDLIRQHVEVLVDSSVDNMIRDIEHAGNIPGALGDSCDAEGWRALQDFLREVLEKRKSPPNDQSTPLNQVRAT